MPFRRPTPLLAIRWSARQASNPAILGLLAGLGPWTPLALGVAFSLFVRAIQTFFVADRLLDSELFPTRLRPTFAGANTIGDAAAQALQNFGLAAVIAVVGRLDLALTLIFPALVVPATVLFLWATTETRGLTLGEAAREGRSL